LFQNFTIRNRGGGRERVPVDETVGRPARGGRAAAEVRVALGRVERVRTLANVSSWARNADCLGFEHQNE